MLKWITDLIDKSQEKSPFRPSCYHQNCVAKSNNTSDHFYDTNSKPIDETKHFCSCQDPTHSHSRHELSQNQNQFVNGLSCENSQKPQNEYFLNQNQINNNSNSNNDNGNGNGNNKSALIEKNYDLPLKRGEHFEPILTKSKQNNDTLKSSSNSNVNINTSTNLANITNFQQNSLKHIGNEKSKKALTLRPQQQKDYSKKLTTLLNKENEGHKPTHKAKKPSLIDINKSLLLDYNNDLSTIKTKEVQTTKSKAPSKSPKINKRPDFFKRNRSISKHEKPTNYNPKILKPMEPAEQSENPLHESDNQNFEVIHTPSSIECNVCKKIVGLGEFMEHLQQCSGLLGENNYESNQQVVFSDISNIHNNMSFNTSSENPEVVEKKGKFNNTIHDSIPNGLLFNRKHDENFFSLAPGTALEVELGNYVKNESHRYVESPTNINMTNEFSTSHKKGLVQDSLINSSFVIKSMYEIKKNSKK